MSKSLLDKIIQDFKFNHSETEWITSYKSDDVQLDEYFSVSTIGDVIGQKLETQYPIVASVDVVQNQEDNYDVKVNYMIRSDKQSIFSQETRGLIGDRLYQVVDEAIKTRQTNSTLFDALSSFLNRQNKNDLVGSLSGTNPSPFFISKEISDNVDENLIDEFLLSAESLLTGQGDTTMPTDLGMGDTTAMESPEMDTEGTDELPSENVETEIGNMDQEQKQIRQSKRIISAGFVSYEGEIIDKLVYDGGVCSFNIKTDKGNFKILTRGKIAEACYKYLNAGAVVDVKGIEKKGVIDAGSVNYLKKSDYLSRDAKVSQNKKEIKSETSQGFSAGSLLFALNRQGNEKWREMFKSLFSVSDEDIAEFEGNVVAFRNLLNKANPKQVAFLKGFARHRSGHAFEGEVKEAGEFNPMKSYSTVRASKGIYANALKQVFSFNVGDIVYKKAILSNLPSRYWESGTRVSGDPKTPEGKRKQGMRGRVQDIVDGVKGKLKVLWDNSLNREENAMDLIPASLLHEVQKKANITSTMRDYQIEEALVEELSLTIENDSMLYDSSIVPIMKNLALKKLRGVYDPELAIKLWGYAVERGMQNAGYGKNQVNPAERRAVAKRLSEDYDEEVDAWLTKLQDSGKKSFKTLSSKQVYNNIASSLKEKGVLNNNNKTSINSNWQSSLQENYDNDFEQFMSYSETYGIFDRLNESAGGQFESPEAMWEANPQVAGGVDTDELRIVGESEDLDLDYDEDDYLPEDESMDDEYEMDRDLDDYDRLNNNNKNSKLNKGNKMTNIKSEQSQDQIMNEAVAQYPNLWKSALVLAEGNENLAIVEFNRLVREEKAKSVTMAGGAHQSKKESNINKLSPTMSGYLYRCNGVDSSNENNLMFEIVSFKKTELDNIYTGVSSFTKTINSALVNKAGLQISEDWKYILPQEVSTFNTLFSGSKLVKQSQLTQSIKVNKLFLDLNSGKAYKVFNSRYSLSLLEAKVVKPANNKVNSKYCLCKKLGDNYISSKGHIFEAKEAIKYGKPDFIFIAENEGRMNIKQSKANISSVEQAIANKVDDLILSAYKKKVVSMKTEKDSVIKQADKIYSSFKQKNKDLYVQSMKLQRELDRVDLLNKSLKNTVISSRNLFDGSEKDVEITSKKDQVNKSNLDFLTNMMKSL